MGTRIRKDFEGSVHITNEHGQRVVLQAGSLVPEGFKAGDHLLDSPAASRDDGDPAENPLLAGNAGDVLDRVGGDKDKATEVLAAEQATEKPRKGLIADLQKVIDDAS